MKSSAWPEYQAHHNQLAAAVVSDLHPKYRVYLTRTLHPVIVTIRDNRDYIRVLLYSYYTTITGWGVLLRYTGRVTSEGSKTWS